MPISGRENPLEKGGEKREIRKLRSERVSGKGQSSQTKSYHYLEYNGGVDVPASTENADENSTG